MKRLSDGQCWFIACLYSTPLNFSECRVRGEYMWLRRLKRPGTQWGVARYTLWLVNGRGL